MNPAFVDSRLCFFDGPVAVFLKETSTATEIMAAYERIGRLVRVAVCLLENEKERLAKEVLDGKNG